MLNDIQIKISISKLNDYLSGRNQRAELVLFGGSLGNVLLPNDYRETMDIDFQVIDLITDEELQLFMRRNDIEIIGGVMEIPPQEDYKYQEVLTYSNLTVFIPDMETFALTKLFTTRGKDLRDLENYPILDNCNIPRLKYLANDYMQYVSNPNNPDLNYYQLESIIDSRELHELERKQIWQPDNEQEVKLRYDDSELEL